MPLWTGRFKKSLDKKTNDFNSSIPFDCRMAEQDIRGSVAHATMLGKQGIIAKEESEKIVKNLKEILLDIDEGKLSFDMTAEDIHTFVEGELTKRIGDSGKRLHTARSRNDQVALDLRLYMRDEVTKIISLLKSLIEAVKEKAEEYYDGPDPIGKTHVREGVVIRIVNRPKFCAYKHKNFSFKVLEGLAKDIATEPDMEEAQEVIENDN